MADLASILVGLADPTRRRIFESLAAGPRAVSEIARDLPVTRPAVSQHLRVLKAAGLVADRALGARRLYGIAPEGLAPLRAWLDRFPDGVAEASRPDAPPPA